VTKTVAIADANSGIGRAAAIELSKRRWRVVVTDRDQGLASETLALLETGEHDGARLDLRDAIASVVNSVAARLGLDASIDHAGISIMNRLVDVLAEDFDRVHAITVRGVFFCGQAAARAMMRNAALGGPFVQSRHLKVSACADSDCAIL
jgi:meso-butanediol dehydrogenase/(S,S)-butanediol dehydrogenase/diacetyl reductase